MNNERIKNLSEWSEDHVLRKKSYHRTRSTGKPFTPVENNLKSKSYRFGRKKNHIFFSKSLDFHFL
jgi:hypothetical protein